MATPDLDLTLFGDFETRSGVDIKAAGGWAYCLDPGTEVLVYSYLIGGVDDVRTWAPGMPCPPEIIAHAKAGGKFSGWNAGRFERLIWRYIMVPRHGWPELADEQWLDTASLSRAIGLPGGLDGAAMALGLAERKDKAGKLNMMRLAKPLKKRFFDPDDPLYDEDELRHALLGAYNRQDVRVEAMAAAHLPPLPPGERAIELLDWRINDRGIGVDLALVDALNEITRRELHDLDRRMATATDGAVPACSAMPKLKAWLGRQGIQRDTLRKEDLAEMLSCGHLPDDVLHALKLRAEAGKASTKKFAAMRQAAGEDHRLRGMFLYHGAATGRWSGQLVQLQNLIRDQLPPQYLEEAINLSLVCAKTGDIGALRFLCDQLKMSVMDLASRLIRPCLIAGPGLQLQPGDLSQIEARVLPWLAGADRLLDVFRSGLDPYIAAAAGIYGIPYDSVTKAQRQVGKVAVLALGYQGAIGAFQTMAGGYGVALPEDQVLGIVRAWRQAHHEIVAFWYALDDAAKAACRKPGTEFFVGRLTLKHANGNLYMRLPSGRWLTYWRARISERADRQGQMRPAVVYSSAEGRGRMSDVPLYGGLLAENATQAVAADCLRVGLQNLELVGLPIVGHVHDEAILEIKRDQTRLIRDCMTEMPPWAGGLPVAVDVPAPARRYGK